MDFDAPALAHTNLNFIYYFCDIASTFNAVFLSITKTCASFSLLEHICQKQTVYDANYFKHNQHLPQ